MMSPRGRSTATSVLSSKRSMKSRGLYILEILKACAVRLLMTSDSFVGGSGLYSKVLSFGRGNDLSMIQNI